MWFKYKHFKNRKNNPFSRNVRRSRKYQATGAVARVILPGSCLGLPSRRCCRRRLQDVLCVLRLDEDLISEQKYLCPLLIRLIGWCCRRVPFDPGTLTLKWQESGSSETIVLASRLYAVLPTIDKWKGYWACSREVSQENAAEGEILKSLHERERTVKKLSDFRCF